MQALKMNQLFTRMQYFLFTFTQVMFSVLTIVQFLKDFLNPYRTVAAVQLFSCLLLLT